VKLGRGGLVDVEFLAQALQLVHGAAHPESPHALHDGGAGRARSSGAIAGADAAGRAPPLPASRLHGVAAARRAPDRQLELAGPMPARVAAALGYPSRDAFLAAYREHTSAVREAYDDAMSAERSHSASRTGHCATSRPRGARLQ